MEDRKSFGFLKAKFLFLFIFLHLFKTRASNTIQHKCSMNDQMDIIPAKLSAILKEHEELSVEKQVF